MSSQVPKPGPGVPLLSPRGIWFHVLETRVGFEEDTAKGGPVLSCHLPLPSSQLTGIFSPTSPQRL